jgi:hypothetical protein
MATDCPVCSKPLSNLSPVVYKGKELIHASCWTEEPEKPAKRGKTRSSPTDKAPPRS